MGFRAERRRLRDVMEPEEEILASDLLHGVREWRDLSRPPVLVVTNTSIYLLLSGSEKGVFAVPFNELAGVGRRPKFLNLGELQLIMREPDGSLATVTCLYNPRDRYELTGDLITEHFFGRVIKDTTTEFPKAKEG